MQPTNQTPGQNPFAGILAKVSGSPGLGAGTNPGDNAAQQPTNNGTGRGLSYQGGQGAPQGNPFQAILDKVGGGQGGPQASQTMAQPSVLQKGQNPGGSKFLLSAMQALNQFVTQGDDPEDITAARKIITMLTQLMQKDQMKQHQQMQQEMSSPARAAVMGPAQATGRGGTGAPTMMGGTSRNMGTLGNGGGMSPFNVGGPGIANGNGAVSGTNSPYGGAL